MNAQLAFAAIGLAISTSALSAEQRYQPDNILPVLQKQSLKTSNGVFASIPGREFVFARPDQIQATNLALAGSDNQAGVTERRRLPHHRLPVAVESSPATPVADVSPASSVATEPSSMTLRFAFNSTQVSDEQRNRLLAQIPEFQRASEIVITGHTDSLGSATYNLLLSQRRAGAVKDILVANNVPGDRIQLVAAGETQPAASNATPEGRQANRRVIVIY